jgi:hypothetical protein
LYVNAIGLKEYLCLVIGWLAKEATWVFCVVTCECWYCFALFYLRFFCCERVICFSQTWNLLYSAVALILWPCLPAEFLTFYGLLNFYLYTMAFVYSPSKNALYGEWKHDCSYVCNLWERSISFSFEHEKIIPY